MRTFRRTPSLDAAPALTPQKFPVLVFSHGYTGIPSAYTALLEDLASHGYAVLSIVHPYEATAATLADGRVVYDARRHRQAVARAIGEVFGEWRPEDETMAAVTQDQRRGEQAAAAARISRRAATRPTSRCGAGSTTRSSCSIAWTRCRKTAPGGRLRPRLDMRRLGAFGHSMGGVTAAQFCVEDRRCRAGLNLDGIPQYGTMIDSDAGVRS